MNEEKIAKTGLFLKELTERLENELKEVGEDHENGLYFTEGQYIKDVLNVFDKMAKSNINNPLKDENQN